MRASGRNFWSIKVAPATLHIFEISFVNCCLRRNFQLSVEATLNSLGFEIGAAVVALVGKCLSHGHKLSFKTFFCYIGTASMFG